MDVGDYNIYQTSYTQRKRRKQLIHMNDEMNWRSGSCGSGSKWWASASTHAPTLTKLIFYSQWNWQLAYRGCAVPYKNVFPNPCLAFNCTCRYKGIKLPGRLNKSSRFNPLRSFAIKSLAMSMMNPKALSIPSRMSCTLKIIQK